MSCIVTLELQVKPESVDELKELLRRMLPDTRAFAGCNRLDVYGSSEQNGSFVFHEDWESRAHYEKYLAWRAQSDGDALGAMLIAPPKLSFLERIEV